MCCAQVILTVLYSFLGMAIGSIIAIGFLRAHVVSKHTFATYSLHADMPPGVQ